MKQHKQTCFDLFTKNQAMKLTPQIENENNQIELRTKFYQQKSIFFTVQRNQNRKKKRFQNGRKLKIIIILLTFNCKFLMDKISEMIERIF